MNFKNFTELSYSEINRPGAFYLVTMNINGVLRRLKCKFHWWNLKEYMKKVMKQAKRINTNSQIVSIQVGYPDGLHNIKFREVED